MLARVGQRHVVRGGDGVSSIAFAYGFAPSTVWMAPENAQLRELRADGDVLMPGDVVHVPELRPRMERCAMDARHTFRRKGVPALVQVQLYHDGRPRRDEPFELYADGALLARGRTSDEGVLRTYVPNSARAGRLIVGVDRQEMAIEFGGLHPISERSGVQQRLRQLGFYRGPADGAESRALTAAVRAFQRYVGLPVTGTIDAATRDKLAVLHDRPARLSKD
jgi:hypothetical protein